MFNQKLQQGWDQLRKLENWGENWGQTGRFHVFENEHREIKSPFQMLAGLGLGDR